MSALATAYARLKSGTLWSSTGKCKGYAVQNPGEAAKIDAYVAALDAGSFTAAPPVLATATGQGLVGMLAALAAQIPSSPTSSFVNTARPSLNTAAPKVGDTLTGSPGGWTPTPAGFAYVWERSKDGTSWAVSPTTADKPSYLVQAGDAGYLLLFHVAPLDAAGNPLWDEAADAPATVAVTAPIKAAAIQGAAVPGSMLTATVST